MAVTVILYNSFKGDILKGKFDFETDTIKCMLVTSTYVPDYDNHTVKNDITNEISGTGYTAGGQQLTNVTATVNPTDDSAILDSDDIVWTNVTFIARGAVIYKDTGLATTSPLVCYIDFGADKSPSDEDFTIAPDATYGILVVY